MGTFSSLAAAFGTWFHRSGRELPERIDPRDLALLTVASHKKRPGWSPRTATVLTMFFGSEMLQFVYHRVEESADHCPRAGSAQAEQADDSQRGGPGAPPGDVVADVTRMQIPQGP
jgi:hypothetical protein